MELEKVVNKLKRSNTFIFISVVLVILSSLITITAGSGLLRDFYKETIGYKGGQIEIVESLTAGTNIGYFNNILGAPVFVNNYGTSTEHIYVNKYYYVQAVTNREGNVEFYSVTTRRKNFNPEFKLGGWTVDGPTKTIRLGKSTFSEVDEIEKNNVTVLYSIMGAHNSFYTEGYWHGNPNNYQSYFISQNESGYLNTRPVKNVELKPETFLESSVIEDNEILDFRKNAVINTFTTTAPMLIPSKIDLSPGEILLGPDYNQVRVMK